MLSLTTNPKNDTFAFTQKLKTFDYWTLKMIEYFSKCQINKKGTQGWTGQFFICKYLKSDSNLNM